MRRILIVFVVLVAALSVVLYLELRGQQREAGRPSGGSGTIEGTEYELSSRIPGRIAEVRVREGDAVEQGETLVKIDCAENEAALAQAEAGLAAARVSLEAARLQQKLAETAATTAERQTRAARAQAEAAEAQRRALAVQKASAAREAKRAEELKAAGSAPAQLVDQRETALQSLEGQLAALEGTAQAAQAQSAAAAGSARAARTQIELAGTGIEAAEAQVKGAAAARDRAKTAVDECTVTSPTDGYVQTRAVEPGEAVMPGSKVLEVIDIREVKATFYLPNAELAAAAPGRKVEVRPDAYPDRVFEGTIRYVAKSAEFTPRNVQTREDRDRLVYAVEVRIENPKGELRPGMPVEVSIPGTGRD